MRWLGYVARLAFKQALVRLAEESVKELVRRSAKRYDRRVQKRTKRKR